MKRLIPMALIIGILIGLGMRAQAADEAFQFFEEEAKALNTPGVITKTRREYAPVTVTTITSEDIKLTPARNIYDLIEVYVPGAVVMNHSESPHPSIRGIISDRNYKILLLVNGRRMNQTAHNGAETELENWDMNDIAKIEIIRGPGSVTYGPGAIEGVINIITKSAAVDPGLNVGVQAVEKYDSFGTHASYGTTQEKFKLYSYGSLTATRGFEPRAFTVDTSNNAGYVGHDFPASSTSSRPPLDYYRDFDDIPQGKAYLQLDLPREWKFWARFTNSGTTRNGVNPKVQLTPGGPFENLKQTRNLQYVATAENVQKIANQLSLQSMISYGSQSHQRRDPGTTAGSSSLNNVLNDSENFSENELLLKTLLNYEMNEKYKGAVGAEYTHDRYGPAWGSNAADFRMGESGAFAPVVPTNIISGPDSNAVGTGPNAVSATAPTTFFVGDGWSTDTYSALSEINLGFVSWFNVLLSGRLDKNSYSQTLYSPRAAVISDLDRLGIAKLVWQKSVRMGTAEQLLVSHLSGGTARSEKLNGVEFTYEPPPMGHFSLTSSVYYNTQDVMGWNGQQTALLGNLRLWGAGVEGLYRVPRLTLGVNHAYVKQIKWSMSSDVTNSGISYADYNRAASGALLSDTGNNLNNIATNVTKLYANFKATKKMTLHGDTRIIWGYPGALDGLTMVQNAAQGTASQNAVNNSIAVVRSHNAYKLDWRLNASVNYDFTDRFSANVFCLNLLGANDNKRYSYDAGVTTLAPTRVAFVEEPRVVGIKLGYKFF